MGKAPPLPLLGEGAANLLASLVWVQPRLPLTVALGDCQAPLMKGVDICAQITKRGINMVSLPLSSPAPRALCLSLSPGGPRMDCPESQ